ncbi:MAG: EH signature domain-containing protein [Thermodesulfovibrionales bacterium]|nr:EH signature domain-containing protein [Thermodesulfovibrionales bacterium]
MNGDISTISFEYLFSSVRRNLSKITNDSITYQNINAEQSLRRLRDATQSIGNSKIQEPLLIAEVYKNQWQEFLHHKRATLDKRAVRYLCWNTEIALNSKFINYIVASGIKLSTHSICALVRASYMKWSSAFINTDTFIKIRKIVLAYTGHHPLLNKWKYNIELIFSTDSTSKCADLIVQKKLNLSEFFTEWGIDIQSNFVHEIIIKAARLCRERYKNTSEYYDYYMNHILSWEYWELSSFKEEIAKAILSVGNNDTFRDKLKLYILSSKKLGDPRLPHNINWNGIDNKAKELFISWLSLRDIVFFFEHVLPTGSDRHGRKNFWLKYIKRLKASRPLLCDSDRFSLKLKMDNERINYGYISGTNSAFVLDFGNIVAIEFSKVGACYLYEKENFNKIVDDLFRNKYFNESSLKNKGLAIDRIIHLLTVNCDWRIDVANILARYGIRPD